MIDTHAHLDGEEFANDLPDVIQRARQSGVSHIMIPAIDLPSAIKAIDLSQQYPGILFTMVGLHPEEVKEDWCEQLEKLRELLPQHSITQHPSSIIAIGEVGLDYYWSRDYAKEQLQAFEEQVRWSVETRLPLMIHCRKAQQEMVRILRKYQDDLPGGIFHCFTGNQLEARELLTFPRFALGIGGVLTFKKSHLPEDLPAAVPLNRIVLETDSPYMAPVPHRGQRNEPAYVSHVQQLLAQAYGVSIEEVEHATNATVARIFNLPFAEIA